MRVSLDASISSCNLANSGSLAAASRTSRSTGATRGATSIVRMPHPRMIVRGSCSVTLIVQRLAARGLGVRVLTRDRKRAAHLEGSRVEVIEGDVRDGSSLGSAMAGVSYRRVCDSWVRRHRKRFAGVRRSRRQSPSHRRWRPGQMRPSVLMSIVGASAEHPIELFRMKYAAEEHLRASGVPWTIVRATAFAEFWLDLLDQTAGASGRPGRSSVEASTLLILYRSPMSRRSSSERSWILQRAARRLKSAVRRICPSTSSRQACRRLRDVRRRHGMYRERCCACSRRCLALSSRIAHVRCAQRLRWTRWN